MEHPRLPDIVPTILIHRAEMGEFGDTGGYRLYQDTMGYKSGTLLHKVVQGGTGWQEGQYQLLV